MKRSVRIEEIFTTENKSKQRSIVFLLTFLKIKLFSFVLIYFTSEISIYNLLKTPVRIRANATASDATRHQENDYELLMQFACFNCDMKCLLESWRDEIWIFHRRYYFCVFGFHLLHFSLGRNEWTRIWFWVNLRINLILFLWMQLIVCFCVEFLEYFMLHRVEKIWFTTRYIT